MKEKINIDNYEVFLIDFLDGNLSEADEITVIDFLEKNPEIKSDFDAIKDFSLPKPNLKLDIKDDLYKIKENLYKSSKSLRINEENCQDYFIAFVNNDLSEVEKSDLHDFVKSNPKFEKDFNLFQKTCLKVDSNIKFPNKESLKKPVINTYKAINQKNYSDFIIAKIEGDLGEKEVQDFKHFISLNPSLKKEVQLFEKTILKADKSIIFEHKHLLKSMADRKIFSTIPFSAYFSVAAAAVVVFLISFVFKLQDYQTITNPHSSIKYSSENYFKSNNNLTSAHTLNTIELSKIFSSEIPDDIKYSGIGVEKTNSIIAEVHNTKPKKIELSKVKLKSPQSFDMMALEMDLKAERIDCSLNNQTKDQPKVIYAENTKSSEYLERPRVKNITGKINDVVNSSEGIRELASSDLDRESFVKFGVNQITKLFKSE